jgi:hypothetical protein
MGGSGVAVGRMNRIPALARSGTDLATAETETEVMAKDRWRSPIFAFEAF